MKRTVLILLLLIIGRNIFAMSLKIQPVTNAPYKFVESYQVGLVLFENKTSSTNFQFLSISLPLMLKEELKKLPDFFISRKDVLFKGEQIDWKRSNRKLSLTGSDPFANCRSFSPRGKLFSRKSQKALKEAARMKASLRKKLIFKSDIIIKNEQTFDEVAKEYKCHYLLYGRYEKVPNNRIRVTVFLFNAIQGKTIRKYIHIFPQHRVLLDIDPFIKEIRKDIVQFPVASLRIETIPSGAMIYFNKRFVGRTPLDMPAIAATNHVVYLRKEGYDSLNISINAKSGGKYLLKRRLKGAPQTGSIRIESKPAGAEVLIDLIKRGITPLTLTNMKIGDYRLVLEKKDFHTRKKRITIRKDKLSTIKLEMPPVIKGELSIQQKTDRWQTWMNRFFWTSAGSLVVYAILYFAKEDYYNQYFALYGQGPAVYQSAYDKYIGYQKASDIMFGVTIGTMAVSAFCLINYLIVDDKELGKNTHSQPDFYAGVIPNSVFFNWRF